MCCYEGSDVSLRHSSTAPTALCWSAASTSDYWVRLGPHRHRDALTNTPGRRCEMCLTRASERNGVNARTRPSPGTCLLGVRLATYLCPPCTIRPRWSAAFSSAAGRERA
jgi:hypothetical protein